MVEKDGKILSSPSKKISKGKTRIDFHTITMRNMSNILSVYIQYCSVVILILV